MCPKEENCSTKQNKMEKTDKTVIKLLRHYNCNINNNRAIFIRHPKYVQFFFCPALFFEMNFAFNFSHS